jgi:hypothetical protein
LLHMSGGGKEKKAQRIQGTCELPIGIAATRSQLAIVRKATHVIRAKRWYGKRAHKPNRAPHWHKIDPSGL